MKKKEATYYVHQSEEVILHVLFSVESNHRVVNSQQNLNVVVVFSGVAPAAVRCLVDALADGVQGSGNVQFLFCTKKDLMCNIRKRAAEDEIHIRYVTIVDVVKQIHLLSSFQTSSVTVI